jgi:energy-coupling factor transport system permease protein
VIYLEGQDSPFHRIDALSKFAWVILVPAIAYATTDIRLEVLNVFIVLFIALVLARMPWRVLISKSSWLLILALALFFFHNVVNLQGEVIFQWSWIRLYSQSLKNGTTFALRVILIGLTGYVFVLTTSPRQLIVGLVKFGIPYRLAWGVLLALRYVPVIANELDQIRDAQQVRGVRSGGGMAGRLEMYRRYTLPLLASVLRKAEDSALAMDGRGFGAYPQRVFVDDFQWTRGGIILIASSLLYLLLILFSRWL